VEDFPPKIIPHKEHDKFKLLWELADDVAKQDGGTPENSWLRLMDAFWRGELPTLFCFTRRKGGLEGRNLMQLPAREIIAGHLRDSRDRGDHDELLGWTVQDYQRHEPFASYVTRHPRFGLAIPLQDFTRLRENMLSVSVVAPLNPRRNLATAAKSEQRPRRGPAPGTVDRYGDADRALFSEMEGQIKTNQISPLEAARILAQHGRVKGRGTQETRARRLADRYRREPKN
jgi:hypothetical protein